MSARVQQVERPTWANQQPSSQPYHTHPQAYGSQFLSHNIPTYASGPQIYPNISGSRNLTPLDGSVPPAHCTPVRTQYATPSYAPFPPAQSYTYHSAPQVYPPLDPNPAYAHPSVAAINNSQFPSAQKLLPSVPPPRKAPKPQRTGAYCVSTIGLIVVLTGSILGSMNKLGFYDSIGIAVGGLLLSVSAFIYVCIVDRKSKRIERQRRHDLLYFGIVSDNTYESGDPYAASDPQTDAYAVYTTGDGGGYSGGGGGGDGGGFSGGGDSGGGGCGGGGGGGSSS